MITNTITIEPKEHELTLSFLEQLDAAQQHLKIRRTVHNSVDTIIRALGRIRAKLDRPLRLAVAGELNAGKTTLSNVLIGNTTLPTRAISNTRIPTLIHYAEKPDIIAFFENGDTRPIRSNDLHDLTDIVRLDVGLPNELLKSIEILDCPGLSDPQIIPHEFNIALYHVDAAIWCTSGTGPWRKSEEDCWLAFPERIRKRSILVVTRKDKLDDISQQKIMSRLNHEVDNMFNDIQFLSSTEALQAYETNDSSTLWEHSGAQALDVKLSQLIANVQTHRFETAKVVTDRITQHFLQML